MLCMPCFTISKTQAASLGWDCFSVVSRCRASLSSLLDYYNHLLLIAASADGAITAIALHRVSTAAPIILTAVLIGSILKMNKLSFREQLSL